MRFEYRTQYDDAAGRNVVVETIDRAGLMSLAEAKTLVLETLKHDLTKRVGDVMPKEIVDALQVRLLYLLNKKIDGTITVPESDELAEIGALLAPINQLAKQGYALVKQVQAEADVGAVLDIGALQ